MTLYLNHNEREMSLKQAFPKEIPATTRDAVEAMLPADSVCRLLGDKAEEIIDESALAAMYHQTGRGGINPVLLCFVLVLQFLEKLPDRQTAEMVKVRMDGRSQVRAAAGVELARFRLFESLQFSQASLRAWSGISDV